MRCAVGKEDLSSYPCIGGPDSEMRVNMLRNLEDTAVESPKEVFLPYLAQKRKRCCIQGR